jgi:hypothetical protein
MTAKRPNEPIAPTTIPGQRLDPRIPPEDLPQSEDGLLESEAEREARESGNAKDRAVTRLPPD